MSAAPRILFVCLGNICRSPTAEGLLRIKAEEAGLQITIDSAGTSALHAGEAPDPRAQAEARKRGYDFSALRARQATAQDFRDFDTIYVMDRSNLANMTRLRPDDATADLALFLDLLPDQPLREVPDPYFEGGYDRTYDLIERGCDALVDRLHQA